MKNIVGATAFSNALIPRLNGAANFRCRACDLVAELVAKVTLLFDVANPILLRGESR